MTTPDLGHCAGSGADPAQGTAREENDGTSTGVRASPRRKKRAGMIPGTSPLRALLAKERRLLC